MSDVSAFRAPPETRNHGCACKALRGLKVLSSSLLTLMATSQAHAADYEKVQPMQPGDAQLSCPELKTQIDDSTQTVHKLDAQLKQGSDAAVADDAFARTNSPFASVGVLGAAHQAEENQRMHEARDSWQARHDFLTSQYFARCGSETGDSGGASSSTASVATAPAAPPPPRLGPSGLPVDVEGDVLVQKVVDDIKRRDTKAVLDHIAQHKALGIPTPPALSLVEAKAAHDSGDALRAEQALKAVLSSAERTSPQYKEALALYPGYEEAARPAEAAVQASKAAQQDAQRKSAALDLVGEVSRELVAIPGARVVIGKTAPSGNAAPAHEVDIAGFKVTSALISGRQFYRYLELSGKPRAYSGNGYETVDIKHGKKADYWANTTGNLTTAAWVTWDDANAFVQWLSSVSGQKYRLLSEVEWEYLALNRSAQHTYQEVDFDMNPGGQHFPVEFVQFEKGIVGGEWTADCWHETYSGAPMSSVAWTTGGDCSRHVVRGTLMPQWRIEPGRHPKLTLMDQAPAMTARVSAYTVGLSGDDIKKGSGSDGAVYDDRDGSWWVYTRNTAFRVVLE